MFQWLLHGLIENTMKMIAMQDVRKDEDWTCYSENYAVLIPKTKEDAARDG